MHQPTAVLTMGDFMMGLRKIEEALGMWGVFQKRWFSCKPDEVNLYVVVNNLKIKKEPGVLIF